MELLKSFPRTSPVQFHRIQKHIDNGLKHLNMELLTKIIKSARWLTILVKSTMSDI